MKKILCAILALSLAGCAQTTITSGASFIDPAWSGRPLSPVVVDAVGADLNERHALETMAVAALQASGTEAQGGMNIVLPTRDYGESARRREIMNTGAAGVLEILPQEKRIEQEYVPGTYFPGRYHSYGHHGGFYEPGFYDSGFLRQEPHAYYKATLYTLPKYKAIWTGDFETVGPTGMDFNEVAARFAEQLVKKMQSDGVVFAAPVP
jgi:hypothetical protein